MSSAIAPAKSEKGGKRTKTAANRIFGYLAESERSHRTAEEIRKRTKNQFRNSHSLRQISFGVFANVLAKIARARFSLP
jgi:hypothetical protein